MAAKIATIEDVLIDQTEKLFAQRVRTVEWAPPDWDEDYIKRILILLPGVFWIFHGATRLDEGAATIKLDTQWTCVAATKHAQEPKKRARGDAREIGCYDIIEAIIARFDGLVIDNVGVLETIDWNNDLALKLEKQALMTQSASFHMLIDLDRIVDADDANIAAFLRFNDTFDVGAKPTAPPTKDNVELPQ
jgi:phage gp37-like protein